MLQLLPGLTDAQAFAARQHATQRAIDATITVVAGESGVDSVLVAAAFPAALAWTGPGPTLARQAAATGRAWPATRDVPCEGAGPAPSRTVIVRVSTQCRSGRGDVRVAEPYRHVDWRRWRIVTDTVSVRLELPGA